MDKKRERRGRAQKPIEERLIEGLRIALRTDEKALIEAAAERHGQTLSSWARDLLIDAARWDQS